MIAVVLSWSGGKDSALALRALRSDPDVDVRALLTTVTEDFERISMHGVRRELLDAQATAAQLPLIEVRIPQACPNEVYEERMREAFDRDEMTGVGHVAFGDLFLQDIRAYREERLAQVGRAGVFPVWGMDTAKLARDFVDSGFKAIVCCVDPRVLDPSFAGRAYDASLLDDLDVIVVAMLVGAGLGFVASRPAFVPLRRWLTEERPATEDERRGCPAGTVVLRERTRPTELYEPAVRSNHS